MALLSEDIDAATLGLHPKLTAQKIATTLALNFISARS
jgi:hypothetical protein